MPCTVFVGILGAQLWLVAAVGTDVPFHDQWDVEGQWLYPALKEGTLHFSDLFRAHNEHRIVWTHLLNLVLFIANENQWDPLVQLVVGAVLHAGCAAAVATGLGRGLSPGGRWTAGLVVLLLSLPMAGWHNALWGFQSQVYFVLLFGLIASIFLARPVISFGWWLAGWVMVAFALLAMGPGALLLVALLGLVGLRLAESPKPTHSVARLYWPIVPLLVIAVLLHVSVPEHAALRAGSIGQFLEATGRMLAWPHVGQPWAAIALNFPIMLLVLGRVSGRRRPAEGEDFVLLVGGWSVAIALATAWARGGGDELAAGVPSRYADLIMLLPLANFWCVITLVRESSPLRQARDRLLAGCWSLFLLIGWLGVSAQMMRGVILPRAEDRLGPVRVAVMFQNTKNPAVFEGQPRLLVPHPNPASVRLVLTDPRLKGALPPSFQARQPMGPLSRIVRKMLGP